MATLAQRRALASVPPVSGDELWVPIASLAAGSASQAAAPCVVVAVDKELLFVRRVDTGSEHCVSASCCDRRAVALDDRAPRAIYAEAGVRDLSELYDESDRPVIEQSLRDHAKHCSEAAVDNAVRSIAASVDNFGRAAAAGILTAGDSMMASYFLSDMLQNAELGPALSCTVAECLAARVFALWMHAKTSARGAPTAAECRDAYKEQLAWSTIYLFESGCERAAACVRLLAAKEGQVT